MPTKKRKKPQQLSHYNLLKRQWLKRHRKAKKVLEKKHKEALSWVIENIPQKEHIASGAIGALMLSSAAAPAATALSTLPILNPPEHQIVQVDKKAQLLGDLSTVVPQEVRPLTPEEETKISQTLTKNFGFDVNWQIGGKRLNRSYGLMGAEQHLMRFPGDTMDTHLDPGQEVFYQSGMAPGKGAWAYFTNSQSTMTQKDIDREKWYIAVPTFESQDYATRTKEYSDFFKYRKMLVVNPQTGQAVVADIADAGPATFTGKHLGGSPEVMMATGYDKGPRKGAVLYFFIDDPDDKIPLGPIKP